MQQAYTLKALITNTICADMSLRERSNHHRYEKGTTIIAEEKDRHRRRRKGAFMGDSGQIRATEPQNEHRRRRNVRFFGDDVL